MAATPQDAAQTFLAPEEWVDAYGDYLYRYALSRLRVSAEAEEAVQETFLSGIRNLTQFSGTGTQQAWLVGILKRKIIDQVRLRERQKEKHSQEEFDPASLLFDDSGQWEAGNIPTVEPDNHLEAREIWQVVRDCLTTIPQAQADVFVLSVMEQMKAERICELLGISPSNFWVRLHRARLGLAKCVSSKWFLESKA